MRRFFIIVISLILFFGWGLPVRAQTQAEADLYPPDASGFPTVSAFLDVFDASGQFISGLKPSDMNVIEDGSALPVTDLTEVTVPAQITVAINPGPALAARDTQGIARFQRVVNALDAWAQALPPQLPDDLSLVTIAGPIIAHANAKDWRVSLDSFQPDFRSTTPNLQSLSIALDTITSQPPRVGMKRAILFITPHMDDPNIDTLVGPLIQRAQQARVRVFVWFVDADSYSATTSAAAFNTLAMQTGGMFFAASGNAPQYPNPDSYFAPLRRVYLLKYDSRAATGGSHTMSVQIKTSAGEIKSGDQPFNIDLQPPNPIFVSPQLQIVRAPPQNDPYNTKVLLPASTQINIIVEFPDGHKRPLASTTFFVDGQAVAVNKSAPFDKFTWDLSQYQVSGDHKIAVEAVDSLGLSKTSIEIPVTITVVQAPHGLAAFFARYRQYIIMSSIALAGVVLLLIIFMGRLRLMFARTRVAQLAQADPLTQPVAAAVDAPPEEKGKKPKRGRLLHKRSDAPAYLHRLLPDPSAASAQAFQSAGDPPIPLNENDMTFGADAARSIVVLTDPSIAPLHAHITHTDDINFLVMDAGTVAGTWVNFEPVGEEGHLLRHGDVVHFGQLVFRFELKNAPPAAEPKIIKEKSRS
jgi:hypothetical protein